MDEPLAVGVSLEAFVHQHALALTRFAFLITGDRGRGEDVVQEVLFSMYRRFGPWLGIDDPLRYARRSIVNAHVSGLRRRRVAEILFDAPPERLSGEDDGLPADDDVWEALAGLPARQRTVLVLRYYLGHSDREIAQLLECRESSVRSLAARSFKTLRSVLRSSTVIGAAP
jgi:RNA polymerase sigma factor (sigma-70 family)